MRKGSLVYIFDYDNYLQKNLVTHNIITDNADFFEKLIVEIQTINPKRVIICFEPARQDKLRQHDDHIYLIYMETILAVLRTKISCDLFLDPYRLIDHWDFKTDDVLMRPETTGSLTYFSIAHRMKTIFPDDDIKIISFVPTNNLGSLFKVVEEQPEKQLLPQGITIQLSDNDFTPIDSIVGNGKVYQSLDAPYLLVCAYYIVIQCILGNFNQEETTLNNINEIVNNLKRAKQIRICPPSDKIVDIQILFELLMRNPLTEATHTLDFLTQPSLDITVPNPHQEMINQFESQIIRLSRKREKLNPAKVSPEAKIASLKAINDALKKPENEERDTLHVIQELLKQKSRFAKHKQEEPLTHARILAQNRLLFKSNKANTNTTLKTVANLLGITEKEVLSFASIRVESSDEERSVIEFT